MLAIFQRSARPSPIALTASGKTRVSTSPRASFTCRLRNMMSLSHEERTSTEPRNKDLHRVTLTKVETVNAAIRHYVFSPKDPNGMQFLPGQWLDVFCPGIEKAGGFTITSQPLAARPGWKGPPLAPKSPFFTLAVQDNPDNAPAAWLWKDVKSIEGKELDVRVGGSFVWPPPELKTEDVRRAVFIAGGVGINPLISMIKHISETQPTLPMHIIYTTKPTNPCQIRTFLYLQDILNLLQPENKHNIRLELFVTATADGQECEGLTETLKLVKQYHGDCFLRRVGEPDLMRAIGQGDDMSGSVFYVCGPPGMTDEFVGFLKGVPGVGEERVFCEKWW